MNRLIFDHFRRWWWLLSLCALAQFWLGWLMGQWSDQLITPFVLISTGSSSGTLLSAHFGRGWARVIATLPITSAEAGRSYWFAMVGIPAIGLPALLFLGAVISQHFNPGQIFPTERLAFASIASVALLGTFLPTSYYVDNRNWRTSVFGHVLNVVPQLTFVGFLLLRSPAQQPLLYFVIVTSGFVVTVGGWFRARTLILGHAATQTGLNRPAKRAEPQLSGPYGYGAIAFWMTTTVSRAVLFCLGITGIFLIMIEIIVFKGHRFLIDDSDVDMATMVGSLFLGMLALNQLVLSRPHLRVLRTMPVFSAGLAMAVVAISILPLLLLGAAFSGVAWVFLGQSAALIIFKNAMFSLCPVALCAGVLISCSVRAQVYLFIMVIGTASLIVRLLLPQSSLLFTSGFAVLGISAAFTLIVFALKRNSSIYKASVLSQ